MAKNSYFRFGRGETGWQSGRSGKERKGVKEDPRGTKDRTQETENKTDTEKGNWERGKLA